MKLEKEFRMKNILKIRFFNLLFLFVLILCFSFASVFAQESNQENKNKKELVVKFDKEKAKKLGADKYGMKKFVMAFLKRGPNRPETPEKSAELQKAHMENIGRLAEAGKLVLAGPFFGDGDLRGIYIFDVRSVKEAEELTKTDPAIKYGSLVMELKEWYGSAAILEVNEIHKSIAEIEI